MKQIDNQWFEFNDGSREYAHGGYIGVSFDAEGYAVSTGWDSGLSVGTWSAEKRCELAEFMIQRWEEFKRNAEKAGNFA